MGRAGCAGIRESGFGIRKAKAVYRAGAGAGAGAGCGVRGAGCCVGSAVWGIRALPHWLLCRTG
ncbi:hypothetical protein E1J21_20210 [Xanthomonas hortorum pv. vitians]|nr:hypothetical protein [Xanthomonas hortorum pv. vitians]